MPRKNAQYTRSNQRHQILVTGDSLSNNPTLNTTYDKFWPAVLQSKLQTAGCSVTVRNFARAGNTTGPYTGSAANADMISRFGHMTRYGVPDLGIIWGGVNDPGNSIAGGNVSSTTVQASPTPTKTVFAVGAGVGASVAVGQAIFVGSGSTRQMGIVGSVATDTVTLSTGLTNVPAVGAAVRQGTSYNLTYQIQQLLNAGCNRIIVGNTQYLNYTGGTGDNAGGATFYAAYQTLRPYQASAVTAFAGSNPGAVVACDIFTYMQNIVTNTPAGNNQYTFNGTVYSIAQSDAQWHVAGTNQHLNPLGEDIVASAMLATIQAQSGWITALT